MGVHTSGLVRLRLYLKDRKRGDFLREKQKQIEISPVPMRLSYLGIYIHKKCGCVFRLSESNVRNGVHALF